MAKLETRQFFIGARRSIGTMPSETKGAPPISWDNIVISRVQEIQENGDGYEVMTNCKIKTEEFQEVTLETWEEFEEKIPDRIMKPIVVMYGEMRGAKDDRKADTKYFRFVGEKTA